MERELIISYYWACDLDIEIPEGHVKALEEDAEKRIFEMIKEGIAEEN